MLFRSERCPHGWPIDPAFEQAENKELAPLADLKVGQEAEIVRLAEHDGEPVLLRDGRFLVASFHPELTDDTRVHERFLDLVREESGVRA